MGQSALVENGGGTPVGGGRSLSTNRLFYGCSYRFHLSGDNSNQTYINAGSMTPASIRTGSNAEPRPSTSIGSSPSKRFTKSTSCGASYAVGPDTDGLNRKPHHTSQRASEKKKGGNREQAPWPTHADVSSSTRALSL